MNHSSHIANSGKGFFNSLLKERVWIANLERAVFLNGRFSAEGVDPLKRRHEFAPALFHLYILSPGKCEEIIELLIRSSRRYSPELSGFDFESVNDPLGIAGIYSTSETERDSDGVKFHHKEKRIFIEFIVCEDYAAEFLVREEGYHELVRKFASSVKAAIDASGPKL